MKLYIKTETTTVKFGDIEIEKQKFHQHKRHISIKNIDINEIVVSNKVSFYKKGFKFSLATKILKKLDLYGYFFQKWVCFLIKDDELLEKCNGI